MFSEGGNDGDSSAAGSYGGMIRLETRKKGWLGISPSQPINRYINPRFSGGSNAYDACEFDNPCSSTAAHCSKTFGKMDNRRSSYSSYAGNTHIPDIHNRNDMQDNRRLRRLLLSRLKPERQLVLLEPEPARSLSMEVKEVFSLGPPMCEFQFVALRLCKIAPFPFNLIRIATMWRFPLHAKCEENWTWKLS